MHELAITESIVTQVTERLGGRRAGVLRLEIGRLSGVVADAVRFCFEVCAQGTALEGAALDIVEVPGRASCADCGGEIELPDFIPLCTCGGVNLTLLSGRELRIKEVELL
jgi:hydrogenase nickel incorporation protein HypA/HybF